ncbi:hypothetical protein ACFQ9X_25880 [Catenulispora yoronensis]
MAGNTGSGAGGYERDQAEMEVQRFRANLAVGELAHAGVHLGRALTNDPSLNSAYTCLAEFAEAAGSSVSAREILKGIGIAGAPGIAAAIIALLAGEGELSSAVELLGSLAAELPAKPWARRRGSARSRRFRSPSSPSGVR